MSENQGEMTQSINTSWKLLFYMGGVSLLLMVTIFRRNFGVELMTFDGLGLFDMPAVEPVSAEDWFILFQNNGLLGLFLFGLFDLVNYALLGIIFLALYGALEKINKGATVFATVFGFVGITVYLASNQGFAMLTLSHRYAEATTTAQQTIYLAAGEALLAHFNPTTIEQGTGFYLSYLLVLLAGLIISIVMLRSPGFNKWTAYAGILANGIGLFYFPVLLFAQVIIWLPHSLSAVFRIAWYILIAIHLFKLGKQLK